MKSPILAIFALIASAIPAIAHASDNTLELNSTDENGRHCVVHLRVDKFTDNLPVKPGKQAVFKINVINFGTCNLHNLKFVDRFPTEILPMAEEARATVNTDSGRFPSCTINLPRGLIECTGLDVNAGDNLPITITITTNLHPSQNFYLNHACIKIHGFDDPVCDESGLLFKP